MPALAAATASSATAAAAAAAAARPPEPRSASPWRHLFTLQLFCAEPVYQGLQHGQHSWLVGLLGGRFDGPELSGRVLLGGSERRVLRSDGRLACETRFALDAGGGQLLRAHQLACWRSGPGDDDDERVAAQLSLQAPPGRLAGFNQRLLVGCCRALGRDGAHIRSEVFVLDEAASASEAMRSGGLDTWT